jgi:hypothetical protein
MNAVHKAFERNAALINASENWAKGYLQAPVQHGLLMKCEARLERKVLLFFKQQSTKVNKFVDWNAYAQALQSINADRVDAYNVEVIVNNNPSEDDGLVY